MEEDNWGNLQGEIISVTLEQNNYGLGLSLAGRLGHMAKRIHTNINLYLRPQRPRNYADLHLWNSSTGNGSPEWTSEGWRPASKGS